MTTTVLIIVNVFSALAIIVLALMQQSKGDMGSAFGGGSSQSMFGSRGSANFLSRTTAVMCAVFFISSLALAYVYAHRGDTSSVLNSTSVTEEIVVQPEVSAEIPVIDESVPALPDVDGAVEEKIQTIEEKIEEELPAVPES